MLTIESQFMKTGGGFVLEQALPIEACGHFDPAGESNADVIQGGARK
jgi:hypothetical protein